MKIPEKLISNFFTKHTLKQSDNFPMTILNPRLRSMSTDLSFYLALMMPFFILFFVIFLIIQNYIGFEGDFQTNYLMIVIWPWLLLITIILNKDIAKGMSAGKRTFGFKVVDFETNQTATQMQCMIRNLTMLLWPIEVLILFINPQRRIGDLIAKTKVVETEKSEIETLKSDLDEMKNPSINLLILSLSFSILSSAFAFFTI